MRWIEYTKLSNGQSAVICFDKNYRHEIGSGYDYAVAFAIANKKKVLRQWLNSDGYGDLDMTTTGKCGVEGLLWAFKMVREFIGTHMYEMIESLYMVQMQEDKRYIDIFSLLD